MIFPCGCDGGDGRFCWKCAPELCQKYLPAELNIDEQGKRILIEALLCFQSQRGFSALPAETQLQAQLLTARVSDLQINLLSEDGIRILFPGALEYESRIGASEMDKENPFGWEWWTWNESDGHDREGTLSYDFTIDKETGRLVAEPKYMADTISWNPEKKKWFEGDGEDEEEA
jgi:hypothetical protein